MYASYNRVTHMRGRGGERCVIAILPPPWLPCQLISSHRIGSSWVQTCQQQQLHQLLQLQNVTATATARVDSANTARSEAKSFSIFRWTKREKKILSELFFVVFVGYLYILYKGQVLTQVNTQLHNSARSVLYLIRATRLEDIYIYILLRNFIHIHLTIGTYIYIYTPVNSYLFDLTGDFSHSITFRRTS